MELADACHIAQKINQDRIDKSELSYFPHSEFSCGGSLSWKERKKARRDSALKPRVQLLHHAEDQIIRGFSDRK